jgi:hypothetical protein
MNRTSWVLGVLVLAGAASAGGVDGDDFDDNVKDPTRWGADVQVGRGAMTERTQRLEYTVDSPRQVDSLDRPWIRGLGTTTNDWSVQIDVRDAAVPTTAGQSASFGIDVANAKNDADGLGLELYASILDGQPLARGFYAGFTHGDQIVQKDSGNLGTMVGALRVEFSAATKVLTVFYDLDPSDGYQWVQLGAFGVAGSGGADGNFDFGLTDTDGFKIAVYGFSTAMFVDQGLVWGDHFVTDGLRTSAEVHDLAVVGLTPPAVVTLTDKKPSVSKKVKVAIQNRSGHVETITSLDMLSNLVTLTVESLGACAPPTVTLDPNSVPKFPRSLKPKQKLVVSFDCVFDCANDPLRTTKKSPGHSDFKFTAKVDHKAIDGQEDLDPADDVCPHPAPPGGFDTTAGLKIRDNGCGARIGKTFGGDVLTDVVKK